MSDKTKMSFKDAAIHILKKAKEPLSAQEIVEKALQEEIVATEGKTPDASMAAILYVDINKNIFAFDDIIEFMKTSGEAQTEHTIMEFLKENFDVEWSTFNQVNFRLLWLMNLGKIKRVDDGYVLVE